MSTHSSPPQEVEPYYVHPADNPAAYRNEIDGAVVDANGHEMPVPRPDLEHQLVLDAARRAAQHDFHTAHPGVFGRIR